MLVRGFSRGSDSEESACNAGDTGWYLCGLMVCVCVDMYAVQIKVLVSSKVR